MDKWDALEQELRKIPGRGLEIWRNEPMSKHTSFRVGGPAAMLISPLSSGFVWMATKILRKAGVPYFFMGNGTNLLVSDTGYDGVIIKTLDLSDDMETDFGFYGFNEYNDFVGAGSGLLLSKLTRLMQLNGRTGLEWAAGIPGTVGGAIAMNAGAYGGEMSQVVRAVAFMTEGGENTFLLNEECEFSYRHSIFLDHPEWLITWVKLELPSDDPAAIKARMDDLAAQRKAKQPLEYPSAGSTFKRPPAVDGKPVYAAALIDQCGCKGLTVGGAQVSEKHAGFIINRGGATCADILALVEEVKRRVYDQTGITLELEVKTLGV